MAEVPLVPASLLDAAAARFRLLGDPTRLRILRALYDGNEMTVQEIAAATEQSHANTSKHLRLMADDGVVAGRREGLHVHYRIIDPTLRRICDLVCEALSDAVEEGEVQARPGRRGA